MMKCNLDDRNRTAYMTKSHGTVYVIDGTQNFEKNRVIVWVNEKRGYVSCPMCSVLSMTGNQELAFVLDKEHIFLSGYLNGLSEKLDQSIDDMEKGRVQTVDEAWKEIDAV